jgi:hypothetical protein
MGLPQYAGNAPSAQEALRATSNMRTATTATQSTSAVTLAQMDGGADYHHRQLPAAAVNNYAQPAAAYPYLPQQHMNARPLPQHQNISSAPLPPRQQARPTGNAVSDLLPYCTMEPPLNGTQVIALSDVVGSLRELVLLALSAASGDRGSVEKLEGAVGQQAARNIMEFFVDEWEIEG